MGILSPGCLLLPVWLGRKQQQDREGLGSTGARYDTGKHVLP